MIKCPYCNSIRTITVYARGTRMHGRIYHQHRLKCLRCNKEFDEKGWNHMRTLETILLETPDWILAGKLAIIYFIIILPLSMLRYTNYVVMTVSTICTALVFFIWCWFIFSLWRKKHDKVEKQRPWWTVACFDGASTSRALSSQAWV